MSFNEELPKKIDEELNKKDLIQKIKSDETEENNKNSPENYLMNQGNKEEDMKDTFNQSLKDKILQKINWDEFKDKQIYEANDYQNPFKASPNGLESDQINKNRNSEKGMNNKNFSKDKIRKEIHPDSQNESNKVVSPVEEIDPDRGIGKLNFTKEFTDTRISKAMPVHERTIYWKKKRDEKIKNISEKKIDKNLSECTFQPHLMTSDKKAGDNYLTNKSSILSMEKHISKMNSVKQAKMNEEKKKNFQPGSGNIWSNKITVPQTFRFLNKNTNKNKANNKVSGVENGKKSPYVSNSEEIKKFAENKLKVGFKDIDFVSAQELIHNELLMLEIKNEHFEDL